MMRTLLAVLACASLGLPQDAPLPTYTIGGVVVNAAGGKPMKRVRVAIAPTEDRTHERAMTTAEDGRFLFDRVPAGRYSLIADTPSGVRHNYGETPGSGFGIAIVAKEGEHNDNIVFRLSPRAAIHGRISDQGGDPVERATVQLFRTSIVAGRRKVHAYSSTSTDADGDYRFSALAPGTWYIVASGQPWYADRMKVAPNSQLARMGYPATFFPGTRDPRSAAPLRLQAGQDFQADFTLVAMPGGTLTVALKEPVRYAQVVISFDGVGGGRCVQRSESVNAESRLGGIPPGRYLIQAVARGGTMTYAEQSVQVGGGDSKVELSFGEAPVVTGALTFDGSAAVPPGTLIAMQDEEKGVGAGAEVAADGHFRFQPIPPGSYRVVVLDSSSMTPRGIRSVLIDSAPAKGQLLEISKAARLEISATQGGSVSGYVYAHDAPAAGPLVVLAPRKDSTNPFDYQGYQTDSDGSFVFDSVAPGDYVLFAVEDLADFEFANPEAVRPHLAHGQPVHVESGKTASVRLTVP